MSAGQDALWATGVSPAMLLDLLEGIDAIVWVADSSLEHFVYVSRNAERLLGFSVEQWRTTPHFWHDLVSKADRIMLEPILNNVLAGEASLPYVLRARHKDGTIRYFHIQMKRISGDLVAGLMLDVSERIKIDTFLTETGARSQLLLQQLPALIYTTDKELNFTTVAGAGLKRLGFDQAPVGTISLFAVFGSQDPRHPTIAPFYQALAGHASSFESEWGGRHFETHVAPLKDEEGRIVGTIALGHDLTERIEMERQQDEFVRAAAHELKTPLTIIKGYAQALLNTMKLPQRSRRLLQAIDTGCDRINRIVNDLLDVSQLLAGRLHLRDETVDLSQVLEDLVAQMARKSPKHRFSTRLQAVAVRGDRHRLKQVFEILLDNAVTYSPAGGTIEVWEEVSDEQVVVAVRDSGIGIPTDRQDKLFQRFYRAHAGTPYDHGGLGVGLFLARAFLTQLGGSIRFESQAGKGSTFYVQLPRCFREAGSPQAG